MIAYLLIWIRLLQAVPNIEFNLALQLSILHSGNQLSAPGTRRMELLALDVTDMRAVAGLCGGVIGLYFLLDAYISKTRDGKAAGACWTCLLRVKFDLVQSRYFDWCFVVRRMDWLLAAIQVRGKAA